MAHDLTNAVREGLDQVGYDYSTPNDRLFKNLQESVYRFSAAKNYQQNKELTALLYDGQRIRSESEWRNLAQKELGVYVGPYHSIERSSALLNSQMAAKVQRFKADKHIMPFVQFRTATGEKACPICKPYDKKIFRIGSHVLSYATPQLHYGCYCDLAQLPESHYEATPDADLPDPELIPEIFRTDLASKMQAFPDGHTYYTGVPLSKLKKWVNKNLPSRE